jgi:hypothetical protein
VLSPLLPHCNKGPQISDHLGWLPLCEGAILTLTLTNLPPTASEQQISIRVTKILTGSKVQTIQLQSRGRCQEAFLRVSTSTLTLQVTKTLLEKSKISVRKNASANACNATESRRLTGRTYEAKKLFKYVTELASCFDMHVNANSELLEPVTDRGEMSIVFQAFLLDISSADRTRQEWCALEGKVMTSLRRQRLLCSKRFRV